MPKPTRRNLTGSCGSPAAEDSVQRVTQRALEGAADQAAKVLAARAIKISMDGKGAWRDNVFVKRLWPSSKKERSACAPMPASRKPAPRSADILASPMANVPIHRPTAKHPIKPAPPSRCPKRWRRNRGGNSLMERPEPVQTNQSLSPQRSTGADPPKPRRSCARGAEDRHAFQGRLPHPHNGQTISSNGTLTAMTSASSGRPSRQ